MSRKLRVVAVIAVQTFVLAYMIGMKQWTLNTGTPIVLETEPIDPRSLFQGDYVRLNYKISNLSLEQLAGDREFKKHDPVYVVLKPADPYWEPVSVHRRRPAASPGQVVIKGEVTGMAAQRWNPQSRQLEQVSNLRVRYGIESYFVPEGEGRGLERPKEDEKVSIRVAVDRFGNAGIQAVLVNGQPRYTESLF